MNSLIITLAVLAILIFAYRGLRAGGTIPELYTFYRDQRGINSRAKSAWQVSSDELAESRERTAHL